MIINIRGTSGSGKSHLARSLMQCYLFRKPHFIEGRKRPLYYECQHPRGENNLFVIGHYETACGGCDTISKNQFDTVFALANILSQKGDVLMEGLLLSAEGKRSSTFFSRPDAVVIQLTTSLEVCVASIQNRRTERGDERPLNPRNTQQKYKQVPQVCERLRNAQVRVEQFTRESALEFLRDELGV